MDASLACSQERLASSARAARAMAGIFTRRARALFRTKNDLIVLRRAAMSSRGACTTSPDAGPSATVQVSRRLGTLFSAAATGADETWCGGSTALLRLWNPLVRKARRQLNENLTDSWRRTRTAGAPLQ